MALYDGINFRPPQAVAREAILGLEYREKAGGRGGLTSRQAAAEGVGSGVQRAASLRYRQNQSPETIRRMVAFFSRHERNKEVKPEYRETPWKDAGKVAWLLWGGDAGRDWAEKILRQMEQSEAQEEARKHRRREARARAASRPNYRGG